MGSEITTSRKLILAVLVCLWGVCEAGEKVESPKKPQTQPAPVTDAERQRIEGLIANLRWSGTIGGGPPLQIKGNESDRELVSIGAPAIPFLLKGLEPVEEGNPLAKRRNVMCVRILGEIGDSRAVEGIVKEMDRQWKDALFLQAATLSLDKIGDERGIPALRDMGLLSLKLFEATVSENPDEKGLDKTQKERRQWWVDNQHSSSANMESLWGDAFIAMGTISPGKAMELARTMSKDGNEFDWMGAWLLSKAAGEKDAQYAQEAESIEKKVKEMTRNSKYKVLEIF